MKKVLERIVFHPSEGLYTTTSLTISAASIKILIDNIKISTPIFSAIIRDNNQSLHKQMTTAKENTSDVSTNIR
jgi:hypothetical protein